MIAHLAFNISRNPSSPGENEIPLRAIGSALDIKLQSSHFSPLDEQEILNTMVPEKRRASLQDDVLFSLARDKRETNSVSVVFFGSDPSKTSQDSFGLSIAHRTMRFSAIC